MSRFQAFLCGRWVGPDDLKLPISDAGFVLGTTVTEQLRTFGGRLFRLDEHLHRLFQSLQIVQVDPNYSRDQLAQIAEEVVHRNHPHLAPGDDLGVGIFVTPGGYPLLADGENDRPTVCVYPYLLPFHLWADHFDKGQSLVVSDVVQISPRSWPPELKCRSRMHYYLADQQARHVDPRARAVLLDEEGFVNEASTANVVMVHSSDGLVSPPQDRILPGISLGVLAELAAKLDLSFRERAFRPEELRQADEVLLTSTSVCVLPAVSVDGQTIGAGTPGPVYRQLISAWNELTGVDIAAQARQFASRVSNEGSKNVTADGRV